MKMNRIAAFAGAFALCLSISAAEFATYREAFKAGVEAQKKKDYETALKYYAAASKLAKGSQVWNAMYREVYICRRMKKWDDALKILDKFLANKANASRKGSALFLKGIVCSQKNDRAQAKKFFEQALAAGKLQTHEFQQTCNHLMFIYRNEKNFAKSDEAADKLLKDKKSAYRTMAAYVRGSNKFDQKAYDECIKIITPAIDETTNKGEKSYLTFLMAKALEQLKKTDESNKYYKMTVELAPKTWRGKASATILKKRNVK